jgi:hypothetical protein
MKIRWWPIALVLVAGGCSSSKNIGSGGDTAATFCDAYLQAVSNKVVLCQGGSKTTFNAEIQSLDLCAGISAAFTLGKLSYSPMVGQACLSEIAATDCGTLFSQHSPPADCRNALTGTVLAGDTCYPVPLGIAQECAPGNRCVADTQCPGVCQPVGTLGSACGPDVGGGPVGQCDPSLVCSYTYGGSGTCVAPPPDVQVGAACTFASQCDSQNVSLVCDGPGGPLSGSPTAGAPTNGTCQTPQATGPCWQDSDCSTYNCVLSASGTTAGACAPPKVTGAACVPGQNQCGNGTYCGTANKCIDLPVIGQSCAGNAGEGTYCANGSCNPLTSLCVPYQVAGQVCGGTAGYCDGFNSQCSSAGICQPSCVRGAVACGGQGQICCAQNLCNAGLSCNGTTCGVAPPVPDAGTTTHLSTGIAITPDAMGHFDGTNPAGVLGTWWATGDDYDFTGTPGKGNCPMAGFTDAQCSSIATPTPGKPFTPNSTGTGMCTSGVAAQVLAGDGGTPAYSSIWGDIIGFNLNDPPGFYNDAGVLGPDAGLTTKGQYDAIAHRVTGIAFDIDTPPTFGNLRVEFETMGTENNAAYWGGTTSNFSPVFAGHNELHWSDVGGPSYLTAPPPFDPTKLEDVDFHVISNTNAPVPFSFCISNIVMLTN